MKKKSVFPHVRRGKSAAGKLAGLVGLAVLVCLGPSSEGQPPPEKVTVGGRVVQPDGETPIAGAKVALLKKKPPAEGEEEFEGAMMEDFEWEGEEAPGEARRLRQTTDQAGRFTFADVEEGEYELRVKARGFARKDQEVRIVPNMAEWTLKLFPPSRLLGRVLGPDGKPLVKGDLYLRIISRREAENKLFLRGVTVRTDAEGRYLLPEVDPGDAEFMAVAQGQGVVPQQKLAVQEGADADEVDLKLTPGGRVWGEVRGGVSRRAFGGTKVTLTPTKEPSLPDQVREQVFQEGFWGDWAGSRGHRYKMTEGGKRWTVYVSGPLNPYETTSRDGDGRFELRDVIPGEYSLRNTPPGETSAFYFPFPTGTAKTPVVRVEAGQELKKDVWVSPEQEAAGATARLVSAADGKPLPDVQADVRVVLSQGPGTFWSPSSTPLRTALTDEQGGLTLYPLPSGRYSLMVRAGEQALPTPLNFAARAREETDLGDLALEPTASLGVIYREEATGHPLAGVTLKLQPTGFGLEGFSSTEQEVTAATDEQGCAEFTGLTAGTYSISEPRPEAEETEEEEAVQVQWEGSSNIVVAPGDRLEGLVVERRDRRPFTVQVFQPDGQTPERNARVLHADKEHTPDPDGVVRLENPNSDVAGVRVSYPDRAPVRRAFVVPPATDLTLRFMPQEQGGQISGTLLREADGKPVADVLVLANPAEWDWETWWFNGWQGSLRTPEEVRQQSLQYPFQTTTDPQGRFTLARLPEGHYKVTALTEGYPAVEQENVEVEEGKSTPLDLRFGRASPARLQGQCVGAEGTPLEGEASLSCSLRILDRQPPVSRVDYLNTDEQGRFNLTLFGAGRYEIILVRTGWQSEGFGGEAQEDRVLFAGSLLDVEEGAPAAQFRFAPYPPRAVTGKVLLNDGKTPAARVFVAPFTYRQGWYGSLRWKDRFVQVLTSYASVSQADGSYGIADVAEPFDGLLASPIDFRSSSPRAAEALRNQSAGLVELDGWNLPPRQADVTIPLRSGVVLRGRVTHSETGAPIPHALVNLYAYPEGNQGEGLFWLWGWNVMTNPEGVYEFPCVSPGSYWLTVSTAGFASAERFPIDLKPGEERREMDVRLWPRGYGGLAGSVVLPDGQTPAHRARIFLGDDVSTPWASTDEQGRFAMDRVPAGERVVYATKVGFGRPDPITVTILPDKTQEVQVVLPSRQPPQEKP